MIDPLIGTANFTVGEWESKSTNGRTPDRFRASAQRTLEALQLFRDALGVPVWITDAWRSIEENADTKGSSATSQHLTGEAVDFVVPGLSKQEVAYRLDAADAQLGDYRQLIYYLLDDHYHLGTGTGAQKLVNLDGTTFVTYAGADTLPTSSAPVDSVSWPAVAVVILAGICGLLLLRES